MTVDVKVAKSKEKGKTDKSPSLSHSALGYQSSLDRWLIGFSIELRSFNLRN